MTATRFAGAAASATTLPALTCGSTFATGPGSGELEIRYTALSFTTPARIHFKYRLDGFDVDWRDADDRRAAYYTNIPPGQYTFRVMISPTLVSRDDFPLSAILRA